MHAVLLFVQLLFAGFAVVGKAVLAAMPPLALAALRVAGATPLLLLIAWRHDRLLPRRGDLPKLAVLGLLGVTANQLLFVLGLERTTASNASILTPSVPVFALAIGAMLGLERPGPRQIAGVALSVAGALVMLDPRRMAHAGTTVGNALILSNCLCYALFLVLQRPLLQRLPWRTVIAWAFVFGGLGVLPVAAPEVLSFDWSGLSGKVWAGVIYLVLLATVIGYALNTWAVRRSSPSLVAAYTTVQPLFAALLAVGFLGERVGWREAIGFGCIAGGLALAGGGSRSHGTAPPEPPAKVAAADAAVEPASNARG